MVSTDEHFLRLLSVSWPRPVEIADGRWTSAPAWDGSCMPWLPAWRLSVLEGVACHTLDWGEFFRVDLTMPGEPTTGEMRGFHVVFRLRVQRGGRLVFFDSDGSIVRRNGEIVHDDRDAHPMARHEIDVRAGDRLDVAQWQRSGPWIWGARWERVPVAMDALLDDVEPYRRRVEEALTRPDGPVVKVYTSAVAPIRCALSIYSLVLNGYRPAGIQIFGDYQWSPASARLLRRLLPFADFVDTSRVAQTLDAIDPRLLPLARQRWGAMKICIGLFVPPHDYCFLDDDVFVLDRVDDALRLFETHRLVYAPDRDYGDQYEAIAYPADPRRPAQRPLRRINTGFYLLRNDTDLAAQSRRLLETPPGGHLGWIWEQGFFAWEFACATTAILPSQRYWMPILDGLPGGLHGYDWEANPCEFACVHFAGPTPKPIDEDAAALVHEILGRHRAER